MTWNPPSTPPPEGVRVVGYWDGQRDNRGLRAVAFAACTNGRWHVPGREKHELDAPSCWTSEPAIPLIKPELDGPPDASVHILHNGRALCGLGPPEAWPGSDRWVRLDEDGATCAHCIETKRLAASL